MNTDIYQTANIVDSLIGGLLVFSSYKVFKQLYTLATLGSISITSTVFWSVLIAAQVNYLT